MHNGRVNGRSCNPANIRVGRRPYLAEALHLGIRSRPTGGAATRSDRTDHAPQASTRALRIGAFVRIYRHNRRPGGLSCVSSRGTRSGGAIVLPAQVVWVEGLRYVAAGRSGDGQRKSFSQRIRARGLDPGLGVGRASGRPSAIRPSPFSLVLHAAGSVAGVLRLPAGPCRLPGALRLVSRSCRHYCPGARRCQYVSPHRPQIHRNAPETAKSGAEASMRSVRADTRMTARFEWRRLVDACAPAGEPKVEVDDSITR